MLKVTAYTAHQTSAGMQTAFAYAEIDEKSGKILEQNKRGEIVVFDKNVLAAIEVVFAFLQGNLSE